MQRNSTNSGTIIESFYQGETTICCGYSGPNLNIDIDNSVGLNQSSSDIVSTFDIAGQTLTKLSGLAGVRIGLLKHAGHSLVFEISGKDKTEKDFGEIYKALSTFKFTNSSANVGVGCKIGGCSGQICQNETDEGAITTCEYKSEYACYKTAKCEKQADGKCGWTQTAELISCLANPQNL